MHFTQRPQKLIRKGRKSLALWNSVSWYHCGFFYCRF